jgi:hypothetical protein
MVAQIVGNGKLRLKAVHQLPKSSQSAPSPFMAIFVHRMDNQMVSEFNPQIFRQDSTSAGPMRPGFASQPPKT